MTENEYQKLKTKFLKAYANLPENIRYRDTVAVVDGQPYTWASAFLSLKEDSDTGKKILKTLKELEIL